tara:strand:- start:135 stop:332 length:198 start_codon:yes stop_codon:yes gene_type:complete
MKEEFLSISDAAKYLNVSISTLRRWTASKKIEFYLTEGNHRRFSKKDLENYLINETCKGITIKSR